MLSCSPLTWKAVSCSGLTSAPVPPFIGKSCSKEFYIEMHILSKPRVWLRVLWILTIPAASHYSILFWRSGISSITAKTICCPQISTMCLMFSMINTIWIAMSIRSIFVVQLIVVHLCTLLLPYHHFIQCFQTLAIRHSFVSILGYVRT